MNKLTKSQINMIIARSPKEMDGKQPTIVEALGYFRKAGANWAYHAGWTAEGQLVVTRFGAVVTDRIIGGGRGMKIFTLPEHESAEAFCESRWEVLPAEFLIEDGGTEWHFRPTDFEEMHDLGFPEECCDETCYVLYAEGSTCDCWTLFDGGGERI